MIALLFALVFAAPPGSFYTGAPAGKVADTLSCALTGSDDCEGEWVAVGSYQHVAARAVCTATCDAFLQFSIDGGSTTISNVKVASDASTPYHALEAYATHARLVVTDTSAGANTVNAVMWLRQGPASPQSRVDSTFNRYSNTLAVQDVMTFDGMVSRDRITGFSAEHKFGRNDDVGTSLEPITAGGVLNFQQAADEYRIKAGGNVADTAAGAGAQAVTCVALLAGTWTAETFTLTTAGASASTKSANQYIRPARCWVSAAGTYGAATGGANTGPIVIETEGGTELMTISATVGQTQYGAYTCPGGFTCHVRTSHICVDGAKGADVFMWQRMSAEDVTTPFSSRRLVQQWPGLDQCDGFDHVTWEAYPEMTDIWFTAITTSGSTADVTVEWEMMLEATE